MVLPAAAAVAGDAVDERAGGSRPYVGGSLAAALSGVLHPAPAAHPAAALKEALLTLLLLLPRPLLLLLLPQAVRRARHRVVL